MGTTRCAKWSTLSLSPKSEIVLAVLLPAEHPPPFTLDRLAYEYELKDELDSAWAVRRLVASSASNFAAPAACFRLI